MNSVEAQSEDKAYTEEEWKAWENQSEAVEAQAETYTAAEWSAW